MVSLSGYGRTGPRSSYLAYATNISNFPGLTSTWQYQHGTHSDYIAAVHAAVGVLAAIAQADRTGTGAYIDVAQTEALAAVMAPIYLDPLNNGRDTPPTGQHGAGVAVHGRVPMPGFRSLARDRARGRVRLVDVVRRARASRSHDRRRDGARCPARRSRRRDHRVDRRAFAAHRRAGAAERRARRRARCTTAKTSCAIRSCVRAGRASRSTIRISV